MEPKKHSLTSEQFEQLIKMLPKGCVVTFGAIVGLIGLAHTSPYYAEYFSANLNKNFLKLFNKNMTDPT